MYCNFEHRHTHLVDARLDSYHDPIAIHLAILAQGLHTMVYNTQHIIHVIHVFK